MSIGGGKGDTGKSGRKRAREDDDEGEGLSEDAEDGRNLGEGENGVRNKVRRKGKERRAETLGQKKVDKEVFRKGKDMQSQKAQGQQWSR